jgi:NAD(P)-dependent dehydrogenase (short-subunit alcohol dehydrogenase family)
MPLNKIAWPEAIVQPIRLRDRGASYFEDGGARIGVTLFRLPKRPSLRTPIGLGDLRHGSTAMSLKDKTIVVTGGSRGLGLGLVEALVDQGASVTVVARDKDALANVKQRLGVAVNPADVTDEGAAQRILAEVRPDILVLNAGATPPMGRLDQLSWADFTAPWETDVKAGLYWIQAALNLPLEPGSRVLVGSSGAAENGSPLSGGYAGAKRMLWLMAKYANGVARQKGLGIRFQAIVPQQIIGGTGVGDNASRAYAQAAGLDREMFERRLIVIADRAPR